MEVVGDSRWLVILRMLPAKMPDGSEKRYFSSLVLVRGWGGGGCFSLVDEGLMGVTMHALAQLNLNCNQLCLLKGTQANKF